MERNITELVSQMTLEEKAGLVSGKDYWNTKSVERLGIRAFGQGRFGAHACGAFGL